MSEMICGFAIERGIPIPIDRQFQRSDVVAAMRGLEVGQSFVVSTHEGYTAVRARWTDLRPKRFAMRKIGGEGWRLWRLE